MPLVLFNVPLHSLAKWLVLVEKVGLGVLHGKTWI